MPRMIMAGIPQTRFTCDRSLYWIMRILGPSTILGLVLIIDGTLFYEVIKSFCYFTKFGKFINCILLFILLFGSLMTVVSLGFTIFSDPGTPRSVIRELHLHPNPLISQELIDSLPRCDKCGQPKPPRCHHCSQCGECHLKMDHHCPSVGVCIALNNQKSFIAMLNWGISTLFFSFVYSIIFVLYIWNYIHDMSSRVLLVTLIVSIFSVFMVLSIFRHDQMNHVIDNVTTIEENFGLFSNYSQGVEENMRQVFGSGKFRTYIPGKSPLTGFEWALEQYKNNINESDQLGIDVDIE